MERLATDLGSTGDYLQWMSDALDAVREAEAQLDRIVVALRQKGASWEQIGTVLGMTKEGARKKYAWISFLPADYR